MVTQCRDSIQLIIPSIIRPEPMIIHNWIKWKKWIYKRGLKIVLKNIIYYLQIKYPSAWPSHCTSKIKNNWEIVFQWSECLPFQKLQQKEKGNLNFHVNCDDRSLLSKSFFFLNNKSWPFTMHHTLLLMAFDTKIIVISEVLVSCSAPVTNHDWMPSWFSSLSL